MAKKIQSSPTLAKVCFQMVRNIVVHSLWTRPLYLFKSGTVDVKAKNVLTVRKVNSFKKFNRAYIICIPIITSTYFGWHFFLYCHNRHTIYPSNLTFLFYFAITMCFNLKLILIIYIFLISNSGFAVVLFAYKFRDFIAF